MRQWHLPPELMCQQHLLGEHVEHHMFIGALQHNTYLEGYIKGKLLIPSTLYYRHKCLVREMFRRKLNHKSILPEVDLNFIHENFIHIPEWDLMHNLADIVNRCSNCAKLVDQIIHDRRLNELMIPWQLFITKAINDRNF